MARGGLLSPSVPEDVFIAFKGTGIDGPYCQFLRRVPLTLEIARQFSKDIAELPTVEARARHATAVLNSHWQRLDENAVEWDRIVVMPNIGELTLGFLDKPPRFGTGCGRVEQCIGLMHLLKGNLALFQDQHWQGRGILLTPRDAEDDELVIAITDGPPVVAATRVGDLIAPGSIPNARPDERAASAAGVAVLVWAVLHERLQRMFDEVTVPVRIQLSALTRYFERRTPALEWKDADFDLLEAVRRELIAAAPLWRAEPGEPTPAPPPLPQLEGSPLESPLTARAEKLLVFFEERRYQVLKKTEIASLGPYSDRETVGALCTELLQGKYIEKKKTGLVISTLGRHRLRAYPARQ